MRGGRGGEADLDGVEVVERLAPDRLLLGRVAAVALVGDDQVEGVDRDVELLDIGVDGLAVDRQRLLAAEQVHRHPLDRRDVDEGVAGLRVGQQGVRHARSGRTAVVAEVGLLEALRVELVDLVELQARLRLERGERADRLRGKRPAVDEEQHAPGDAGLHQPVDLVDRHERLAGAGGHRDQQLALAVADRLLDRRVGLDLVRTQPRVLDRMPASVASSASRSRASISRARRACGSRRPSASGCARAGRRGSGSSRRWSSTGTARRTRHEARVLLDALAVALGLGQDALRADGELLGLDDADGLTIRSSA